MKNIQCEPLTWLKWKRVDLDLDAFRQLPEFRQLRNWGIFLQQAYKVLKLEARVGCWLQELVAGSLPTLISASLKICECRRRMPTFRHDCRNLSKNAQCENEV